MSAMSRDGGTMVTSDDSACAICARRLSFGVAPYTSLRRASGRKSAKMTPSKVWKWRLAQSIRC